MLHYAFCKEAHMDNGTLYASFACDDGVTFKMESNYDSILRKNIQTGDFFIVKSNKQDDVHLRGKINKAPYSKEDYENVINYFKTGNYVSDEKHDWRAIHAARRRLMTTHKRSEPLEVFMKDFDVFFQK